MKTTCDIRFSALRALPALPTLLALCALLALSSASGCDSRPEVFIEDSTGVVVASFVVDVAVTEVERMNGLRGREPLAAGEGLLLEFPVEDEICIVNDGVSFAIDAAYVDASGTITVIERGFAANDATPRCHAGTKEVLETRAGGLAAAMAGDVLR